jgi:hypothetical protein
MVVIFTDLISLNSAVKKDQVMAFKFWFNGAIREGLFYQNQLFFQFQRFKLHQQSLAYALSSQLWQKDIQSIVILSCQDCTLWIDFKAHNVQELLADIQFQDLNALVDCEITFDLEHRPICFCCAPNH